MYIATLKQERDLFMDQDCLKLKKLFLDFT